MDDVRIVFNWRRDGSDIDLLCARLRPGSWLVEPACRPPPRHAPAALTARIEGAAAVGGVCLSLRTDSAFATGPVSPLVGWLGRHGCALAPLAEVAIHEILVNALIHGNLAITSGPSAVWADLDARQRRIAAALADPVRAARCVTLAADWTPAHVAVTIADEGSGYSPPGPASPAAPTAPTSPIESRGAGRGLVIARGVALALQVRQGGSCTRLVFARPAAATAPP